MIPSFDLNQYGKSEHRRKASSSIGRYNLFKQSFNQDDTNSNNLQDGATVDDFGIATMLYGRQSVKPILHDTESPSRSDQLLFDQKHDQLQIESDSERSPT